MHLSVDTASATPPYEQLRAQLADMVTSGSLPTGARLPPIRQLAGDLGLAANTVARAYRELEADGLVQARGRHGTVVTGTATLAEPQRRQAVEQAAVAFAQAAERNGAGLDDAIAAVRDAFDRLTALGAPVTPREGTP